MSHWQIHVTTDEAAQEVASLFQDEDIRDEIRRLLDILVAQDDPRSPLPSSGIRVGEIVDDAPGWFALYVPRYAIRIVFRLLVIHDERIIEIMASQVIPGEADERIIDIMQAAFRNRAYGDELRRRWRRYRGKRP